MCGLRNEWLCARKETLRAAFWLLSGLAAAALVLLWIGFQNRVQFLVHSPYDSYTLQALAWRQARAFLLGEYPWLELAVYNGNTFVSFPPVPSVPMWLLTFFFSDHTPSALATFLYVLGGYVAAFFLARRYLPAPHAAGCALFACLGGSLPDIAVSAEGYAGGVWYQAQALAFLLTMLAFCCLLGRRRAGHAAGLILLSFSVGCRPLNALYVPAALFLLYRKTDGGTAPKRLRAMLPYVAVPALIACAYGAYNFARFQNPLEFGHAYLPEYTESGDTVFALSNLWGNLKAIWKAPWLEEGALRFPITQGFAVYLTNPLFFLAGIRALERLKRREADALDAALCASALLHALLLLTHRTNGGWQYGTRYLCDLLPALLIVFVRGKKGIRPWEAAAMGALALFNVYATVVFHAI